MPRATGTGGPPSIVFVLTDQQRADSLGCYGNGVVRTPNIDGLAAGGTVFDRAYVTQPVCTPARASILTGLYPHTHGSVQNNVPLAVDARTLAERIPRQYHTAYMGKWHLGHELTAQHGFQQWVSTEDRYLEFQAEGAGSERSSYHHYLAEIGLEPDGLRHEGMFSRLQTARLAEHHTKARFLGREAARFIRESGPEPFLLCVSFLEPHRPYAGPFDDLYPPESLPVGPHFRRPPGPDAALVNRLLAEHYARVGEIDGDDLSTETGARRTRAKYLGNVTLVDRAVGDILRALDECGRRDDTTVVYTSEHGDMLGDHALFGKCVMYEEAVRVPLVVRAPWLARPAERISGPVSQVDLVPTLLDLAGVDPPAELQGASLSAVLTGQRTIGEHDVVIEWNGNDSVGYAFGRGLPPDAFDAVRGPWRTIVSADGWKLNLSTSDQCELYDLTGDPYEQTNLFNDSAQSGRIAAMTSRLSAWQSRTGDTDALPRVPGTAPPG